MLNYYILSALSQLPWIFCFLEIIIIRSFFPLQYIRQWPSFSIILWQLTFCVQNNFFSLDGIFLHFPKKTKSFKFSKWIKIKIHKYKSQLFNFIPIHFLNFFFYVLYMYQTDEKIGKLLKRFTTFFKTKHDHMNCISSAYVFIDALLISHISY